MSEPTEDKPKKRKNAEAKQAAAEAKAEAKAAKADAAKAGAAEDADAKAAAAEGKERKPGRLARLRFAKKKDMPGGLWLKCENCSSMVYRKELEDAGRVCPACKFHFTLPGRERVDSLLDADSFEELFADLTGLDRLDFVDKEPYGDKLAKTVKRTGQNEALICGRGTIEGRAVVLAVLDFKFMGGSMGEVVGEKFSLACDIARREQRPLVCFTSSGGARMHEGALSLMQMAKTCAALASLNDAGGMSICVMTHPTTGGVTASFASVCDVVIAEPGALIGFAGPRVIAATLKQELPAGFQRAEFLIGKGMLDSIVPRTELRPTLARLMDYGAGSWVGGRPANVEVQTSGQRQLRSDASSPREAATSTDSDSDADAGPSNGTPAAAGAVRSPRPESSNGANGSAEHTD